MRRESLARTLLTPVAPDERPRGFWTNPNLPVTTPRNGTSAPFIVEGMFAPLDIAETVAAGYLVPVNCVLTSTPLTGSAREYQKISHVPVISAPETRPEMSWPNEIRVCVAPSPQRKT